MRENQTKFVNKWQSVLKEYYPNKPENILFARDKSNSIRVLFIDDRIPAPFLGAGYPRAYNMLHFLADLGYKVTFFPLQYRQILNPSTQYLESLGIEMFYDNGKSSLDIRQFLNERTDYYDIVLISRPHNASAVIEFVKERCRKAAIIYDAEALFSEREIIRRRLEGIKTSEEEEKQMIDEEISLMKRADVIMTVSELEKETIVRNRVKKNVMVWGSPMEIRATKNTFSERQGILFVGGFINPGSPNADSLLYFAKKVYPIVRDKLDARLFVVGAIDQDIRKELISPTTIVTGHVDDLMEYYEKSRVFIVPTRYAAGIPWKLQEAMSYGVPSVITPLVGKQLQLTHRKEVLIGGSPEEFAENVISLYEDEILWNQLRDEGFRYIKEECNPQKLRQDLDEIVKLAKKISAHI
jgi:glycosyltransferase involved in cell wall biosynthesis